MKLNESLSPERIIALSGGYSQAVDNVMALERALWDIALMSDYKGSGISWHGDHFRVFDKRDLFDVLRFESEELLDVSLNALKATTDNKAQKLYFESPSGRAGFAIKIFRPFFLVRTLLGGVKPDHDLRYYVMRNIRRHYRIPNSAKTAHLFYLLGDAVNALRSGATVHSEFKPKHVWNYANVFVPRLHEALLKDALDPESTLKISNLFIECCREAGYLWPHFEFGCIDLRTTSIDPAFLISNLYGMPTGIRGFDELLGGGGPMLAEDIEEDGHIDNERLGGRAILIKGRFGTGKSLLSLQFAAEVARKGGLAWVMPLEQSAEECLYTLESMNALPNDHSVIVATNSMSAIEVLQKKVGGRGALIILKTLNDSYDDFLIAFADNAKRMSQYPLRLIIVDPLNSIYREETDETRLRAQTVEMLGDIKKDGTNVLLVAEESVGTDGELLFEQNIADTVIRLSTNNVHGYARRDFEIMKSRLQREHRGEHPFRIISGTGITVYPSAAAVSARIRPRAVLEKKNPIRFGLTSLDDILGKDAITAGDIIVLQGAGGSFKTPLGLLFLLGSDWGKRSLLVGARDDESTIQHMLKQNFVRQHITKSQSHKNIKDLLISALPHGYVYPGYIVQRIEDALLDSRLEEQEIDRLMIDNIAHWEMSSPFVQEDKTFGDTLLEFLRRQRVTSLVTCGELSQTSNSVVQRSIVDGADCIIQFDRFEFRGTRRVMIKVIKTRGMDHRRESFEITLGAQGLEVKPTSSLLRIMRSGEISPIKVRLFFHSRNDIQSQYNNKLLQGIQSILTAKTEIDVQDRIYINRAARLGSSSAVDELQVLQLDELQLPNMFHDKNQDFLYQFPNTQWDDAEWGDFVPRLSARVRTGNNSFFAIPYYTNISLLAYRQEQISAEETASWSKLVKRCEKWERDNPDPKAIFFDFPKTSAEDYNCLFFEILLSTSKIPPRSGSCQLLELLRHPDSIEASKVFRRLCRRAYLANGQADVVTHQLEKDSEPIRIESKAVVWRHWYSTLNHMMYQLNAEEREGIKVCPLPGDVAVGGEWFCAVTAYSAAPDVGLQIIKLLTSHEAELDRLLIGVGLPTRSKFYGSTDSAESINVPVSPYFQMNLQALKGLVYNAFRRSDFGCYSQLTNVLAYHLQRMIGIPDGTDKEIEQNIYNNIESLEMRLKFMRTNWSCNKCRMK
ncbi:MAG TPA: ATPase domain-containing protein [Pyrinomonadaceae bacterium]|jgi:KaiC/GvpD/RAD55 family RecA-like ATPase